jgi:hypothetical protein
MQPRAHWDRPQVSWFAEFDGLDREFALITGEPITLRSFSSFFEPHFGQSGFALRLCTRISDSFLHSWHRYSYSGMEVVLEEMGYECAAGS